MKNLTSFVVKTNRQFQTSASNWDEATNTSPIILEQTNQTCNQLTSSFSMKMSLKLKLAILSLWTYFALISLLVRHAWRSWSKIGGGYSTKTKVEMWPLSALTIFKSICLGRFKKKKKKSAAELKEKATHLPCQSFARMAQIEDCCLPYLKQEKMARA